MPGILYKILSGAMLSIRTKGDFLSTLRFSHGRILTLFMRFMATLNIALIRNTKSNKIFQEIYTYIVVQL